MSAPIHGLAIALPSYVDKARAKRIDLAIQIAIAATGIAAALMIATTGPLHRWGYVVAMVGQPLWFVASWRARQPGFFILSIFYTGAWAQGIVNRFF